MRMILKDNQILVTSNGNDENVEISFKKEQLVECVNSNLTIFHLFSGISVSDSWVEQLIRKKFKNIAKKPHENPVSFWR